MRLFFVVIGFKVKRYKNRGAFKYPCHCEPQARLNFRVIASVPRQFLFSLSLRAAGAAIPRNKARHIERKRNIPPIKHEAYAPRAFSVGYSSLHIK